MFLTRGSRSVFLVALLLTLAPTAPRAQEAPQLPSTPLVYGFFTARFAPDGTFSLQGTGWPALNGTWKVSGDELAIVTSGMKEKECAEPGRYRLQRDGTHLTLALVADPCEVRRMILDRSDWRPEGEPPRQGDRKIVRTAPSRAPSIPKPADARGSWPSFRGPNASGVAEGQDLPDTWNPATKQNILWRTPIPGLAHSSPIVWGDRIFVTTAISSKGNATFKPGLYGDGDASDDLSRHKWMLYAIDKRTGKIAWERLAFDGEPRNKRHIKSTYASATPATDGRIVVAWFGSQGIHAFTVDGKPLWQVDIGRVNMGAYDIPAYEWGPASSPIIWNDLVIVQCDTHADSFLLALDAKTGKTVWKTDRDELPSWGTPSVLTIAGGKAQGPGPRVQASGEDTGGPQLVTNASKFIRGYDPRTGKELWRLGGSSKITAPTPIAAGDLFIVASGRGPERPIFAVRPGARGDVTLAKDARSNEAVAWSKVGRGPYMPTPLAYQGILYVVNNNGVLDTYDIATGQEIYRQRLPSIGSGYSASPVAADGKIYLSNEDGDMLVIAAGREFRHIGTNSMGELLMATPAISEGVMYVKTVNGLFAIGKAR